MSEEWSEEWLYGESANDGLSKPEDSGVEGEVEKKVLPQEVVENQESSSSKQNEDGDKEEVGNGDAEGASREDKEPAEDGTEDRNEDESEDDDDDDSDDDGVQVTIGDIKAEPLTAQAAAFGPKQRAAGPPPDKKGKFAVEDFEATGTINGVPAQDFSLDSLEEKPWRKPGADITDYFNYGFTEETWRAYCDRQKRLRHEAGGSMPQSDRERKHHTGSTNIPIIGSDNSKYGQQQNIIFPKKFGSMDRQKDPQRIPRAREEPRENTIQVMTADRREYSRKSFDMPPQMGPPPPFDMSMPPPTYGHPPPDVYGGPPPPEFFGHPPPPFFPGDGPPHPHPHQMGPNPHGMMHHHPPPHHAPMDYEEQQWMDSSWESNLNRPPMQSVNSTVVPVMKVNLPPPPGESDDDKDKDKS